MGNVAPPARAWVYVAGPCAPSLWVRGVLQPYFGWWSHGSVQQIGPETWMYDFSVYCDLTTHQWMTLDAILQSEGWRLIGVNPQLCC